MSARYPRIFEAFEAAQRVWMRIDWAAYGGDVQLAARNALNEANRAVAAAMTDNFNEAFTRLSNVEEFGKQHGQPQVWLPLLGLLASPA